MTDIKTLSVSVAMAVYNGEKFIKSQIDSILVQLRDCDELIISYDESTDNTIEIISEYSRKHPIIKVVHDPGKGVFSNFENAISNTTKDIIFISDQDDIWLDGKLDKVLNAFGDNAVDMVIHNGVHIDSENNVISDDFFTIYNIRKGLLRNFIKPRYSGCCTAFRAHLKQVILPIPRGVGAYDHWIGMIGERYGSVVFLKDVLLQHRLHGNNVTVSTRPFKEILSSRMCLLKELKKRKALVKQCEV